MKLIDLYKEWMETGVMPDDGLCGSVPNKYSKQLSYFSENGEGCLFWGNGGDISTVSWDNWKREFTPLRQTIVLLICAMCDEL